MPIFPTKKLPTEPKLVRRQPQQDRAQHTVNSIFEATTKLVVEDGASSLSTNKIAQKAGVSIGTLYQYFPTKEAILQALINRTREDTIAQLHLLLTQAEQRQETDYETLVREFIRINIAAYARGNHVVRAFVRFAWQHDDHEALTQGMREIGDHLMVTMLRNPQTGWRTPTPALIFVLTRSTIGAIRSAAVEESPLLEGDEFREELVRLALNILRA